jgi:hypothetical protein
MILFLIIPPWWSPGFAAGTVNGTPWLPAMFPYLTLVVVAPGTVVGGFVVGGVVGPVVVGVVTGGAVVGGGVVGVGVPGRRQPAMDAARPMVRTKAQTPLVDVRT